MGPDSGLLAQALRVSERLSPAPLSLLCVSEVVLHGLESRGERWVGL
ncbi:MAG: hypothetical protein KAS81_08015 [Anaerolineales bacterium]|nr:hypothetical protein [Anaerolineales bacterium]